MRKLVKPASLFDRAAEWAELASFMSPAVDSLRLGVVYGRRRQGKSEMLRQLCDAVGGFYSLALEQHAKPLALQRFADGLAEWAGLPSGMRFTSWEDALQTAVRMAGDRATTTGTVQLIVIDELPFLMTHSPEVPGVLQMLYDTYGPTLGGGNPSVRIIVCGSALSIMSRLLGETQALYGRAMLNICLDQFDHVDSAAFWGIEDHETAFRLHAIVGGVPGYKELTAAAPVPSSVDDLDAWLAATLFNPSHALFDEVDLLFSHEPAIKDRTMYYGILAAVAGGESTPARIAAKLARDPRTITYPLSVLRRAGFITHDQDALFNRKPVISIADPVMRFHHTITIPRLQLFQRRNMAGRAWADAQQTFSSQILGRHFEQLARDWTISSPAERTGRPIGWTGTSSVACREHKISHQLDVVALATGDMPRTSAARVVLIGEAKCTNKQRNLADLTRLEHIRQLLGERAEGACLALFSRSGFQHDLVTEAHRDDVTLVTLSDIYHQ
jgi:AAA+ ATPase superfamily predicted ATPase